MGSERFCPRCGGTAVPPGEGGEWSCVLHGPVLPLDPPVPPGEEGLATVREDAQVPLWLPWPLPSGWLVTGFLRAGDERSGTRAAGVALSGPGLAAGPADMLLVSEEVGVGLGAHYAGLKGTDPGPAFDDGPPNAKVTAQGRPVPLWAVDAPPDRAVYAGEALGRWLWAVLWPAEAGVMILDRLQFTDLREPGMDLDLPFGAPCPRLAGPPPDEDRG
ncbi:hypothetical protein EDD29_0588 [Actinocorallia herbida]|uniref:Phosphotransacetylase n=1 Tax=Actinocorallia herbida TaxID=58109 RepID=A0A3N1CQU6_9ACTN|nr:DUF6758 family protein [Actinocorallia herbida]ROO83098.1 hypothetical protein EDD29_0588 [Actinocorallia herbida]